MDPMGGVVPGGSPNVAGPAGPGPVQRKVAGEGGAGLQPTFKGSSRQDVDEGDDPWYKNKEKRGLVIVIFVFLFVFIPFGVPNIVKLFDQGLGNKVDQIVKLKFLFGKSDYRDNQTDDIHIDQDSIKIQSGDGNSSITYVVGDAKNISSRTLKEVELYFHLYDSSDTMLGEVMEYKDEIEPNSTWSFKAVCMFTNVVRADPVKVIVR